MILEVAHSGHIDALGALWIAVSAWMLSTGRGMRAAIAFVIAVATKLLPIVLVPLLLEARPAAGCRGRRRCCSPRCYLPFASAGTLPLGDVPNVVAASASTDRCFKALARGLTPQRAPPRSPC